jgi:hypothetical protein
MAIEQVLIVVLVRRIGFAHQLNDVGHAGTGGLDPDEFWHAWARGAEMAVDIFDPEWNVWDWIEMDLEDLRREWNVTQAGRQG